MKTKIAISIFSSWLLFSTGCSRIPEIAPEPDRKIAIQVPVLDSLLNDYDVCYGNGILTSSGNFSTRLTFSYSSRMDSSAMSFIDLMGRRVLEIHTGNDSIYIKDLLKNRIISSQEIINTYPLFSWMNEKILKDILWGIPPDLTRTDSLAVSQSGRLDIEQQNTEYGTLLSSLSYSTGQDRFRMEFHSRSFKNLFTRQTDHEFQTLKGNSQ